MLNYKMEEFKQSLVKLINESNLPAGVVYYMLKDCLNELSTLYQQAVEQDKANFIKEGFESLNTSTEEAKKNEE